MARAKHQVLMATCWAEDYDVCRPYMLAYLAALKTSPLKMPKKYAFAKSGMSKQVVSRWRMLWPSFRDEEQFIIDRIDVEKAILEQEGACL